MQEAEFAYKAVEWMLDYYRTLADRPLMPDVSSEGLRARLSEPLPQGPTDLGQLLDTYRDVIVAGSRHNGHPRFFGYVASPGNPIAAVGDLLASALNSNVTAWRSGPAATEIEHVTINWIKEIVGYPAGAGGLFVSGGSMANFAGLAAARAAKGPPGLRRSGVAGQRLRIYAGDEVHFSIRKAAGLLGIGEDNVQVISDLREQIRADRAAAHLPVCVVGNGGSVSTGAIDPLAEMATIAHEEDLWFHVDAAYGGFAMLAASARPRFAGIELADSVALDPHKWLYLPSSCGCILYRDPSHARAAFSHDAEYTRISGFEQDEAFAFWDYGPELSRRFRALNVWLWMKSCGVQQLGGYVERNLACARYLEDLVHKSSDFEMLAPVELSIFCFRYAPPGFSGDLDELNERIMQQLQHGGSSYVSNAKVNGRFALRGCCINYRTTERDMEILLDDVRAAAASVL